MRNASATIEALGHLGISAGSITNANDHFAYETRLISTQYGIREDLSSQYYRIFDRYTYEPVVTQDDPGQILAGGNITLSAQQINNQQSKIVAGGTLTASAGALNNLSVTDQRRVNDVGTQWSWGVVGGHSVWDWGWKWVLDWGMAPSPYNVNTYPPVDEPYYSIARSIGERLLYWNMLDREWVSDIEDADKYGDKGRAEAIVARYSGAFLVARFEVLSCP